MPSKTIRSDIHKEGKATKTLPYPQVGKSNKNPPHAQTKNTESK